MFIAQSNYFAKNLQKQKCAKYNKLYRELSMNIYLQTLQKYVLKIM